ncbi:Digalactosyldiacylglycerol synthase, family GT4 [Tribonema minus]|uniref:digalactosyldiacylglycerol synthase n=1 Tax=Tribonema minus TaxID=303371 RepID=A0A835YK94_9STRA|nr:Digalactosyldiacylglycerol synthase, family GT4 [Tribonema minus]
MREAAAGGGERLGDLRTLTAERLNALTAEGKVRFANFTASSTELLGNFTALSPLKQLGGFAPPALGGSGRRAVDLAVARLKMPQIPSRLRRARVGLQTALDEMLDDIGLDSEDLLSTVLERVRALQAAQDARDRESELTMTAEESRVLPVTDIAPPHRRIWIVTTAALPWMTGTSVNPLLRAAYLARGRAAGMVSLMVPFIDADDQELLKFPADRRFATKEEQTEYLRNWLRDANMAAEADALHIVWYEGRYLEKMGCIFPMGDITRLIPDEEADVCIMEEPEHINWYRATGTNWSKKFKHVVGVIHTNYVYYAAQDRVNWGANIKGPWVRGFNKLMARAYCDKIIKLSATLQKFAEDKETVCNVHGVRERFLQVGDAAADDIKSGKGFEAGGYMLGKMLWEKGYDRLWELMHASSERLGSCFPVDVYGTGPELDQIRERAEALKLQVTFHPATDHATLSQYRLFVNPSVSEVLCTTIAEALAMGKWVVCARHSSNEFFYQFPNCLPFDGEKEFSANVYRALTKDPAPLTPEQRRTLSWTAATERLIDAAKVTVGESKARRRELDEVAWVFHQNLGEGRRGDTVRKILQAGVVSEQNAYTAAAFGDMDTKALPSGGSGGGGGGADAASDDAEAAGAVVAAAAAAAAVGETERRQ